MTKKRKQPLDELRVTTEDHKITWTNPAYPKLSVWVSRPDGKVSVTGLQGSSWREAERFHCMLSQAWRAAYDMRNEEA